MPPHQLLADLIGKDHFSELLTASAGGRERYQGWYLPMAERLATCVQDLPLSPGVFSQRGGALQFGLMAGLLSVRLCDATIFDSEATAQERHALEPLFRWSTYCATLASAFLMCAGEVEIKLADGQGGYSFASDQPLGARLGAKFVSGWKSRSALPAQAGLIYLQQFFYPGQFEHLQDDMLAMLGGSINPALVASPVETPMARVVRQSMERVLEVRRKRDAGLIIDSAPDAMHVVPVAKMHEVQPAANSAPQPTAGSPVTNVSNSAPAPKTPQSNLPQTLLDWIKSVSLNSPMEAEIVSVDEGRMKISKKVLSFAGTVKENYQALFEGGLIHEKNPNFVICNKEFTRLVEGFRSAAKKEG